MMTMSKKKYEPKQPDYVAELLLNGTVVLKAKSTDELVEMADNIPADCSYGVGAVGYDPDTCDYSLRIDLTKSETV